MGGVEQGVMGAWVVGEMGDFERGEETIRLVFSTSIMKVIFLISKELVFSKENIFQNF